MSQPHTTTVVDRIPPCDIDAAHGPAVVDAGIKGRSSWAYMCEPCWRQYGRRGPDGELALGLGVGQRLMVRGQAEATAVKVPPLPLLSVGGLLESMGIAVSYDDGVTGR